MSDPLPRTLDLLLQGLEDHLHLGAALYVSVRGQTVADLVLGEAAPGQLLTHRHLCPYLSSGKPLTALAIAWLWERKLLRLDDPVQRFIPDFAGPGKDAITLRHCLTHTAGLRNAISAWTRQSPSDILRTLCQAPIEPGWVVGRTAGYHVASTWYLLGEVVRVVATKPLETFLRDFVLTPLGMTSVRLTFTPEQWHNPDPPRVVMHDTSKSYVIRSPAPAHAAPPDVPPDALPGPPSAGTAATADPDRQPPTPLSWESPEVAAVPRPGSGFRGTAHDLGRLYEFLLGHLEPPTHVLSHTTREALTARHRVGLTDLTFRSKVDWALGFICESSHYNQGPIPYQFGPHASPRTFGHGGNQSSVGFADPQHGLSVALLYNGMPGDPRHDKRLRETLAALYTDLGLA
ncbi:MAG: serine hydrolase domain-containing protein [Tepidisphaerales bacterium]